MAFQSMWSAMLVSPAIVVLSLVMKSAYALPVANQLTPRTQSKSQTLNLREVTTPKTATPTPSSTDVLKQIDDYSTDSGDEDANSEIDGNVGMSQINNVSQLQDVQPGDWAYAALQNLVERYGCIAGYPNGNYRGNRAMTRYEFAAGLNACLDRIQELIATSTANLVNKQDLATLGRLREEFRKELAELRGRVDNVEAKIAEVQATQFSTTTKLNAEVVMSLQGFAAGDDAEGKRIPRRTVFGNRIRLNFDTSFTGKDLLRTRLQALNLDAFSASSTLTPEGDLRYTAGTFATGNNNSVGIDALYYQFPIGEKTKVFLEANASDAGDYINTINPLFDGDGAVGALSNFGTLNPLYNLLVGAGIVVNHDLTENLQLSLAYISDNLTFSNPAPKNGFFNGAYGALGQVTIKPNKNLTLGLLYVHSYNADLAAGSRRANLRSYLASISAPVPSTSSSPGVQPAPGLAAFGGLSLPVSSNSYGIEASYQVNPKFVINGWVDYTASRILRGVSTESVTINQGDLSIWNFAINLGFPDFLKKGSLAGIVFGMEPKVTRVSSSIRDSVGTDPSTSFHIEGFYQYQLTDNIAITPALILLTAPDHNSRNASDVIGVLRTTFTF